MLSSNIMFLALMAILYSVQGGPICQYPNWVENTQYCEGQKVTNGNSEWMAKWCTLEKPALQNEQGQTSSWNRIRFCIRATPIVRSDKSGTSSCDAPNWVEGIEYCKGEKAVFDNIQWIAKWCTLDEPGTLSPQGTTSAWISEGMCQELCTAELWVKNNQYCAGDNVLYEGVQWQAKWCNLEEPAVSNPQGQVSAWIIIGPCTMPSGSKTSRRVRCM